jgi:hypothetical protein
MLPTHLSTMARVSLAAAVLALLVASASAQARPTASAPQNVHAFELRANESVVHTFSRTPSFAWNPVVGAVRYEFELSTSRSFSDNAQIWAATNLKSPTAAIPLSLPWSTGKSYSLFAHVRAFTKKGFTAWSQPFGFNMRWSTIPAPLQPGYPGLLRWTSVPGANGYNVWLTDLPAGGKIFTTNTNQADEREYYTFHQDSSWSGTVHWRVRATRLLSGKTDNGLPTVSYGPWSPIYTSTNPAFTAGPLRDVATVSTAAVSDASQAKAHEVMPAFLYSGNTSIWNTTAELYRVEVFTDEDCLNVVFRGSIVGSPAYVPRLTGPLGLPTNVDSEEDARTIYLQDGTEPDTFTYDSQTVKSNETPTTGTLAKVDLWDSDWPTGHYYWTVMPVNAVPADVITTTLALPASSGATTITVTNGAGINAGDVVMIGSPGEAGLVSAVNGNDLTLASAIGAFHSAGETVTRNGGGVTYHDAELTQDSCASGRVLTFGKTSEPVVTGASSPYISGLSPNGKLVSAATRSPKFYGPPLVAWQPAVGADQYEVQWGHTRYPWKTVDNQLTFATSLNLPLKAGTWYYRVRGLDSSALSARPQMSWSDPVKLVVTKPRFRVVHH